MAADGDVGALAERAQALFSRGRLEEAVAVWERIRQLDPANLQAALNIGMTLRDVGRTSEAEVILREALALDPESAAVLFHLSSVVFAHGATEAIDLLRRARALDPDPHASGLVGHLGAVLMRDNRNDEAPLDGAWTFHVGVWLRAPVCMRPCSCAGVYRGFPPCQHGSNSDPQ